MYLSNSGTTITIAFFHVFCLIYGENELFSYNYRFFLVYWIFVKNTITKVKFLVISINNIVFSVNNRLEKFRLA